MRLMHAAMVTGVLLFAIVGHFQLRPTMANAGVFPPATVNALLGVALGACVLAVLLRRRVPQKSRDDSSDSYWTTARTPAMLMWAPLEGACLLSVVLYVNTGAQSAIAVLAIAVVLFIALNPASLERR